uniref:Serpin domain-containing protein n=1 Tax=Poecilia mexicana TaxID=48701 RepID=A0A3B3WTU9_9TELE
AVCGGISSPPRAPPSKIHAERRRERAAKEASKSMWRLFFYVHVQHAPITLLTFVFVQLQKQLTSLGLSDAWDQKAADFSGMSDKSKGKLHLGGALHWASLELGPTAGKEDADLEEENTERPKLFYADHPFIVFVRDDTTGALLLMGALDNVEGELLHDEL